MIRKGLLLSAPVLVLILALGLWGLLAVDPAGQYPVHWGLDGQPDRYGSRWEAFLGVPVIAMLMTGLMSALPSFDPRGDNLRRSSPAYLTAWLGSLGLLALLQLGLTLTALGIWPDGGDSPFMRVMLGGVSLLVLLTGNVLGKARPNWFFGLRTPWTLSSDLAWEKSHRVGGRLMVLAGAAGLLASLVFPVMAAALCLMVGLGAATLTAAVYSYVVWRRAPDRRTGPQAADTVD
jgi:uncharacterized membrane protein